MSLPVRCRGTSFERIDHRTPLAGFLMLLLAAVLFASSARGATFTINTQADFDARKTATYAAGDQILFKRGGIFTGMFAPSGSGTPTSPIRIAATGTGADPIINAMGVNSAAILLRNIECWEIDGIEVTNTNGGNAEQGILFGIRVLIDSTTRTVMRHYHISNCHIHDVNRTSPERDRGAIHIDALDTLGNAPFRLDGVRITGNTIEDCGGVGISNTSSFVDLPRGNVAQLWTNVYVAQNYVARTGRNGIIGRVSKDALYEYNTLSETSRFSTGHSIYNFETSGFIAQHNEAFGNLGGGSVDRGGFDADYYSENTTFQYNYSHDNRWFMGIMCRYNKGITIRYNISQNETDGIYWYGFDTESLLENVVVHNNVHFTRSSLSGVQFIAGNRRARNTVFYNNIFHFAGSGSYGSLAGSGAGVSFSHNVFFNIPVWPHGAGDPNAITSDPRFVNPGTGGSGIDMSDPNRLAGYRLQANSPCINAGRSITGITRDFWGNPAPAGGTLDIGVHETQPAANLPPVITLIAPANGSTVTLPASVSISATASDSDGSIAKVEFYGDGVKLGEDATAPYTWNWSAPAGARNVYAIAQDQSGARTTSNTAFLTVVAVGANAPPSVTLTAPADGALIPPPGRIDFAATASDADGFVLLVEFFIGANRVGTDTTAPYHFVAFAAAGSHQLTAVAVDDDGARTTSAPISITVGEPAPTVDLTVTDASGGEFGADKTITFLLSRSGSTTTALSVPLVASGSATPDADYSGFGSPVIIPVGSSSAVVNLTTLPDIEIEGPETLRLTLGPSGYFTPGSSTTAEATVHDRPLHDWLHSQLPHGAPNRPNDDADGDGEVNLIEYYKGTHPGNATSRQPLKLHSVTGHIAKIRYPRAKNRSDVIGTVSWSRDLLIWHASGETHDGLTVTLNDEIVSPAAENPETVEATAVLSGPGADSAERVFFHLEVTP
jgi:hypothetical protein